MTSTFNKCIVVGNDGIYMLRSASVDGTTVNNAGLWDGTFGGDITMLDSGFNSASLVAQNTSGSDVYFG